MEVIHDLLAQERFVRFLAEGQRDISESDARCRAETLKLGKLGPLFLVVELSLHLEMLRADTVDSVIRKVERESLHKLRSRGWECLEYVNSRNSVIIIIFADDAASFACMPSVFTEIIKVLMRAFGIVIYAGIGSVVGALSDIKRSAHDARLCISYKYSAAHDYVVNIKDVNRLVRRSADEDSTALERVVGCFLDGDIDRLKKRLHELLVGMGGISQENVLAINLMYVELMAQIMHRVTSVGVDINSDQENACMQHIMTSNTPDKLFDWFVEKCIYFIRLIKEKQNFSTQNIAQLAMDYIARNYCDCNLSQQTVSERLGLSTSYFGHLFYMQMGIRFVDYLHNYRLGIAKERLKTTNDKIRDIGIATGFSSVNYFNTIFRKHIGMTPNEYRTVESDSVK